VQCNRLPQLLFLFDWLVYAAPRVVIVPEEPLYFNAPDSTYRIPPEAMLAEGAVPLPMWMALSAEVAIAVVPTQRLPARWLAAVPLIYRFQRFVPAAVSPTKPKLFVALVKALARKPIWFVTVEAAPIVMFDAAKCRADVNVNAAAAVDHDVLKASATTVTPEAITD